MKGFECENEDSEQGDVMRPEYMFCRWRCFGIHSEARTLSRVVIVAVARFNLLPCSI